MDEKDFDANDRIAGFSLCLFMCDFVERVSR
jgi:hypothetical protein